MKQLQDKVLLVTGSTIGIGSAIARRCAAEGARIMLHGLEREEGLALQAELGNGAQLVISNLGEVASAPALIAATLEAFGRLDGLVNNAALVASGHNENSDAAFFDRMMSVNVRAPYLLIQAALPHLQKSRGCVVNIGSVNAYSGEENLLPYSISKGALMTLSRNLGDTLPRSHGVRVNQINPGWVLTESEQKRKHEQGMAADWPAHLPVQFAPFRRIFKPEEIAHAVVYFLGDACGPISGQVLDIEQYPFIGRNPPKL